jgi:hypothetical protein
MNLALKVAVVSGFVAAFVFHGDGVEQRGAVASEPRPRAVAPGSPDAVATGAQGSAPSTPLGAPQAPVPSETVPKQAASSFADEVLRLSAEADRVDRLWLGYKGGCGVRVSREYDFGREWFAVWDRAADPTIDAPRCGDVLRRIREVGDKVGRDILKARAAAHQAGLDRGTEIGMLRWHALHWPQFEEEYPEPSRRNARPVAASTKPPETPGLGQEGGRRAAPVP